MSGKRSLTRVGWTEHRKVAGRGTELYFVLGEKTGDDWEFHERSAWESLWYEILATPALIRKAQKILARRTERSAKTGGGMA